MIKVFIYPNRIAIGELGNFRGREETICWIAAYKEKLPEVSQLVKPNFFLFLNFDDITSEKEALIFGLTPFDEVMAELTAETLIAALKAQCENFIFSCDAGISRSAGMAEAFCVFLKEQGKAYQKFAHRHTSPNLLVKERLLKALKMLA
ncbi:hypothetical protein [Thermodesulfatator autotrophicus]|uniref:Uncharacterized protein n=1 Tax=Thermodesulfatator autotrophicus TaxID=1795632 RepID=A0A177E7P7_9BACT|nr:hypothetical protein [Thermodesulfatator autotrophicus]OAG27808.1 hypothetical protein TH606_05050 [Thermodesulfatator autotrophicus]